VIVSPDHLVELAKEFGGGFAAYWTHHVFHKIWHRMGGH
jgi:ssRNA-specific RNase YbeY (16S rRNA maturation enzyme)